MPNELVVREQRPYELTEKQVTIIANTEFVPKEKRGKHDVIWASIFHGRSIGIDDMTAIQKIHIINGTPALAATLASGIAAQRGHKIEGEMSSTSATAHGERGDNGAKMSVTFTMEDAKAAGLAGKQVYKQHPQSMLWARAVTQLCRSLFPDCFIGGVYTREELGEDYVDEHDIIDGEAVEAKADTVVLEVPEDEIGLADRSEVVPTDLDLVIATYSLAEVLKVSREMFPGKPVRDLVDEEVEALADRLRQGVMV